MSHLFIVIIEALAISFPLVKNFTKSQRGKKDFKLHVSTRANGKLLGMLVSLLAHCYRNMHFGVTDWACCQKKIHVMMISKDGCKPSLT